MTLEPHHFLHLKCDRLTSSMDEVFGSDRCSDAPKMPITHLPAITTPAIELQKRHVAAPGSWEKVVEKLRTSQIELKERPAAAKTVGWTKAGEKVRSKQATLADRDPITRSTSDCPCFREQTVAAAPTRQYGHATLRTRGAACARVRN